MSIVNKIEEYRPKKLFKETPIELAIQNNRISKGLFIEYFVNNWLSNIPDIEINPHIPKQKWIYILNRNYMGQLYGNNFFTEQTEFEFDGVFEHNGKIYPYEVKSNQLNGYSNKISDNLNIIKTIFTEDKIGELLIFVKMRNGNFDYFNNLKKEYNNQIDFVNLVYSKNQLNNFLKKQEEKIFEKV